MARGILLALLKNASLDPHIGNNSPSLLEVNIDIRCSQCVRNHKKPVFEIFNPEFGGQLRSVFNDTCTMRAKSFLEDCGLRDKNGQYMNASISALTSHTCFSPNPCNKANFPWNKL